MLDQISSPQKRLKVPPMTAARWSSRLACGCRHGSAAISSGRLEIWFSEPREPPELIRNCIAL
jgi:hypothetical protein